MNNDTAIMYNTGLKCKVSYQHPSNQVVKFCIYDVVLNLLQAIGEHLPEGLD